MNKIKTSYKIAVTPEQSKEIQKICFKNGINWANGSDTILHIYSNYLYIDVDNMLIKKGLDYKLFASDNKEKINAEDFIKKYGSCDLLRNIPENRTICKTVYKQNLNEFNDEMQKIYDNYINHDIDVKYSTHQHSNCTHFSAFVTITPKQPKENLRIG